MNDLKHSIRGLLRSPGFTIAAVAALTLGIGAASAIFSVINAVLLKPLSYPDAPRIVQFYLDTPNGPDAGGSPARFNVLSRQTQSFEDVTAYEYTGVGLNLAGPYPEQVHAIHVTAGYFHLLGAPVILGRGFTAEEDRPNGGHAAILSYGLWQRRFASDLAIIGKTISLSTEPYTVVGVIGPGFRTELDTPPDIWIPFQIDPASTDNARYFGMVGRLRPGVTEQMAAAQLALATEEFRRRSPSQAGPRDEFRMQRFQDALVLDVRPSLRVLAGAVALVLMIASANVANLLLVRGTARKREIAIRTAIGAGRGRIVRQLLTESLVLSLTGGALGLAFGIGGIRALLAINPGNIPRIGPHGALVTMDWRVVGFTIGVALLTGLVFGLFPALEASHADLNTSLKEACGRSGTGLHSSRTRSMLVTAEIALAVLLLIGSGLLIRSFAALRAVNPGLNPHNVLTMRMSLSGPRFEHSIQVGDLVRTGDQRVEALPGVVRASASYVVPTETMFGVPFNIVGRTPLNGPYDGRGWVAVSPGYFDALRIPVLRGRAFTDRDDLAAARVAIINEALAAKFWPHGEPLGERLLLGKGYGPEFAEPAREIVGIIGDVRNFGLAFAPNPAVYVPLAQVTDGLTTLAQRASSLVWIVRTQDAPSQLSAAIQTEIQQASRGLPVDSVRTMDQVIAQSSASADFNSIVMSIFGATAVLLAAIGVYGLMAYSVAQRAQEIGIRLALGAEPRRIRNMVIGHGMRLALAGLALGICAAFGLTRLLASLLYGVAPRDPFVFAVAPAILAGIALFSVWLPAQRATRIDPITALRAE